MLEGIRILDLTRYFPGPFASLRLQERGAEVIKVEDPNGDPARVMDRLDGEEGVIFRSMSRGKPCVCVNLKDPAEREKFYALVSTADALVESFRPGVTAKLGIDYPTLSKLNPRLVYVSVTGYGQTGTYRALAGHDLNYLAMSGVMDQLLDDGGKPIKPQIALADLVTGVTVSEAVAMGLVKSSRSGQGAYIDLSMTDAMLSFMGLHISNASATGEIHGINDHGIGYGIFETSDGRYVALCALEEKFFANFCRSAGCEELIEHQHTPASADNPYYSKMINIIKSRSFSQWKEFSAVVDCCMSPVLHTDELKDSTYVRERGLIEHKWGLDYAAAVLPEKDGFLNFDKPFHRLGEDNEKYFGK